MRLNKQKLDKAFQKVCNTMDWKGPIVAIVPKCDLDITIKAIEFYTATSTKVVELNKTHVLIRSIGYRMGPAGP